MVAILVEVSKYVLLALVVLYAGYAFIILRNKNAASRRHYANSELSLILLFDIIAFLILYLQSREFKMLVILGALIAYTILIQLLYRLIYKTASLGLLNTMCMLLSIGFVIQSRLGVTTAFKQMIIVALSSLICLVIPVFVRKVKTMRNLGWVFAVVGIVLLSAVFVFARLSRGANLSLSIGGISFQFSEFVKITFVLFTASLLQKDTSFKKILIVSIPAAMHVGILFISKDLGAALIYFIAYMVMVYVATRKARYVFAGLGLMSGASVIAYHLMRHIRVRVQIWQNPFQDYRGSGYQIVQALFGVVAGGWFGTGLFNGNPDMIPLAKEDFTFAAICEEFGVLFGIVLILICMSMYLQIVNISTKLSNPFYRLVAIGLGTEYAFQVFLTVGGTTKFIPMTGITLPLVSYGGSSIMCTIIMLSIIQGLYMIREDEDEEHELLREIIKRQNERERAMQRPADVTRKIDVGMTRRLGQRKNTGNVSGKGTNPRGANSLESPQKKRRTQGEAGDNDLNIDDLEKRIADETEKSLNY